MNRLERQRRRRARIEARRQGYRDKREDLLEKREARRGEKSGFWGDLFEMVGLFVLGILSALG